MFSVVGPPCSVCILSVLKGPFRRLLRPLHCSQEAEGGRGVSIVGQRHPDTDQTGSKVANGFDVDIVSARCCTFRCFLMRPSWSVCRYLGESAGICRRSQTPAARSRCLQAGSRHLQMVPRHLQHASRQTQTPPRHRETHPDTRQTIAQTGALLAVTDKRRANTQSLVCTARLSGTHFGRSGAALAGVCRCLGVSGQTPQAGRA